MTDAEFAEYARREMPGIAAFDEQAPAVVALVEPVIGKMEAIRDDYAKASDIPISFLPLRSAPWLFLGIGVVLVAAGVFALRWPSRLSTAALAAVGLGIALAPIVIGIPGKVDAAVRVTDVGRIGLAPATGGRAVAATKLFDAMAADVASTLRPELDRALGAGAFARDFPTLDRWTDSWRRSTSAQSHALSDSQVELAPAFANADRIPLEPIPWMFIVPGAVLALTAGAALVATRRKAPASATAGRPPSAIREVDDDYEDEEAAGSPVALRRS